MFLNINKFVGLLFMSIKRKRKTTQFLFIAISHNNAINVSAPHFGYGLLQLCSFCSACTSALYFNSLLRVESSVAIHQSYIYIHHLFIYCANLLPCWYIINIILSSISFTAKFYRDFTK